MKLGTNERGLAMYAIIKTGGKQYRVKPGDIIDVEHVKADVNQPFNFDQVLAIEDNDTIEFGTPLVNGAQVNAELLEHRKGKKIIAFKMKRRKRYRRKIGHRQLYSRAKILEINRANPEILEEKMDEIK